MPVPIIGVLEEIVELFGANDEEPRFTDTDVVDGDICSLTLL